MKAEIAKKDEDLELNCQKEVEKKASELEDDYTDLVAKMAAYKDKNVQKIKEMAEYKVQESKKEGFEIIKKLEYRLKMLQVKQNEIQSSIIEKTESEVRRMLKSRIKKEKKEEAKK